MLCISDQNAVLVIKGFHGLLSFPILSGFPVFLFSGLQEDFDHLQFSKPYSSPSWHWGPSVRDWLRLGLTGVQPWRRKVAACSEKSP